jgi:putative FmdB family regulatory protein
MPFYEYECQSCKFYSEVMQKITDPPLRKCPSCGKNALKKLVSAPNFRLKGSGWYETDFKSDKEAKRNLADGGKPDAEAKSEGGETKAADEKAPEPKAAEPKGGAPKPIEVKTASGSGSARRAVAAARKPAKSASHGAAARRPGAKAPSRKAKASSARGKSRR